MEYKELIRERFSCRKFKDTPVEPEKLAAILADGLTAPTAKNFQPYKIWVMQSQAAVDAVNSVTRCGYGAPMFLVVGADRSTAWVREFDNANFADVDASIVATQLMLSIHDQGLRSVWVGWFDAPKLQTLCPEMAGYDLVAILPVGYGAEDAVPSPRHTESKPEEELIAYL